MEWAEQKCIWIELKLQDNTVWINTNNISWLEENDEGCRLATNDGRILSIGKSAYDDIIKVLFG